MRKTFVWALMATLLVAGSAFAADGMWDIERNATFATGGPSTTNNDDSCDIGVTPAATLLLPYFEVDITSAAGTGETTIFTITNVSNLPQVAHITLWTDYSFPVIDFNVYLTGYDVQSINLYDVIVRGRIAPDAGTGSDVSPVGELSGTTATADFDNPVVAENTCTDLPVELPPAYRTRMQSAFTTGKVTAVSTGIGAACNTAGGVHANAVGYATIDVAGLCSTTLPTAATYFTSEIRFDNVLIGDYLQINGNEDFAQGNPMVHIRAIPEGGTPVTRTGAAFAVNFDRTFYSRYSGGVSDARQPLPALFAARWIEGGTGGFETFYKIWREGATTGETVCSEYPALGGPRLMTELVRFDEEENPETLSPDVLVSPPPSFAPRLPETSMTSSADTNVFPPNTQDAVGGWMYMNLENAIGAAAGDAPATQNWVIVSMRAEDRFSVDFDAAWLGNGCTPEVGPSEATTGTAPIGPAPNFNPNL